MTANRSTTRSENVVSIIVVLFIVGFLFALIWPALHSDRIGPRRNELMNNMRNVGIATTNFTNGNDGQLPPALPGQAIPSLGTPPGSGIKYPISFFTALLPLLDQPRLSKAIDTTVPWTHPKNRKAYGIRVATFEWPARSPVDHDNSKTPEGYAITHILPSLRVVSSPGHPLRFQDITDGTATTIMLGTIDDARVPAWGAPGKGRDPAGGFAGGQNAFGGLPSGALIVFADGHAGSISKNIDPAVARALATPAGGEVVTTEDY